jgi:hypothetical protein
MARAEPPKASGLKKAWISLSDSTAAKSTKAEFSMDANSFSNSTRSRSGRCTTASTSRLQGWVEGGRVNSNSTRLVVCEELVRSGVHVLRHVYARHHLGVKKRNQPGWIVAPNVITVLTATSGPPVRCGAVRCGRRRSSDLDGHHNQTGHLGRLDGDPGRAPGPSDVRGSRRLPREREAELAFWRCPPLAGGEGCGLS